MANKKTSAGVKKVENPFEEVVKGLFRSDYATQMEKIRKGVSDKLPNDAEVVRVHVTEDGRGIEFDINADSRIAMIEMYSAVLEVRRIIYSIGFESLARPVWTCDPWVDGEDADELGINECRTIITISL